MKLPTQEFPASDTRRWLPRAALMAALLVAAWLLWSGLYKPLLLGLGIFSVFLTLVLLRRMGYFRDEAFAFRYGVGLLAFWGWLAAEIVKSSLEVARVVLSRTPVIEPQTVTLDVHELGMVDQALLGNSITLTPGTLTLDVYKDRILVHALTASGAAALKAGEMQRRVAALGS